MSSSDLTMAGPSTGKGKGKPEGPILPPWPASESPAMCGMDPPQAPFASSFVLSAPGPGGGSSSGAAAPRRADVLVAQATAGTVELAGAPFTPETMLEIEEGRKPAECCNCGVVWPKMRLFPTCLGQGEWAGWQGSVWLVCKD